MEPDKTHGSAKPQQILTHPARGYRIEPQPSDFIGEGYESANPHAGQGVAKAPAIISGNQIRGNERTKQENTLPLKLTNLDLFKILEKESQMRGQKMRPVQIEQSERTMIVLNALYPKGIPDYIQSVSETFHKAVSTFVYKCEKLYKASHRNRVRFIEKNKKWLMSTFHLKNPQNVPTSEERDCQIDPNQPHELTDEMVLVTEEQEPTSCLQESPQFLPATSEESVRLLDVPSTSKLYEHLSSRSQRRARKSLEEVLSDEPIEKIIKVISKIAVDETGNKLTKTAASDFEFVVKECLRTPTQSIAIANIIRSSETTGKPYTPDEALCFMIDRKLSVEDYISMQQGAKSRGFNIYPPYYKIQTAKKLCHPDVELFISERDAKIPLFDLLMHTFRRIIELSDQKVSDYCKQNKLDSLQCIFEGSWGFDGSTGQATYKQKFSDESDDEHCLFATTYIPLRIKTVDGFVLWWNPNPQSFRFCRPIQIQYRSETKELILKEKKRVEEEIKHLSLIYAENSAGHTVIGDPKLYLTIIDGKVFNAISNTNSQLRCACCGATCIEFNNLDLVAKKSLNQEALQHGLSPLHAWIRVFEFLLHLGYKNDPGVQKWRVTKTSVEASIVERRKKQIQTQIRQKMGLLVDVVKPNSGTTNDGNTARIALSDANRKNFADILGIEEWLVEDLHTILVAISSGLEIDTEKFNCFCQNLAQKYVQNYSWYYMSVTIHKILIHGAKIIESISLPIGMLSEQAGESRNKFWRYDREHHTRKLDRKTTILDLFNRALESSDPFISTMSIDSRKKHKKSSTLPAKVLALLKPSVENVVINDQFIATFPTEDTPDSTDVITDSERLILSSEEILTFSDYDENL